MGANLPQGGKTRRRSLDAELNVVPFIDLLSMCICFLLMTAIWVEINSLQIKQILGTEGAAIEKQSLDIQVQFVAENEMWVSLERGGQIVQKQHIQNKDEDAAFNTLSNYLATVMAAGMQLDTTARVVPHAKVNYGRIVAVLDLFKSYGVHNLAMVPVRN